MHGVAPPVVVRTAVRALAGRSGTRWIGVDGLGGSGKSSLARRLAQALPGSVVVPTDDFADPDAPSWAIERFIVEVLRPLAAGRAARYRRWPYGSDRALAPATVPPGVPVIVEGVSAIDARLPVPWDLTVWVEAPPEVRHRRILDRDPPELLEVWRRSWWPSEEAYAAAQRPWARADVLADGTLEGTAWR